MTIAKLSIVINGEIVYDRLEDVPAELKPYVVDKGKKHSNGETRKNHRFRVDKKHAKNLVRVA